MSLYLRSAQEADVEPITTMVNRFAAQNVMLPRTADSVRQTLADWLVCVDSPRGEDDAAGTTGAADTLAEDTIAEDALGAPARTEDEIVVGCGALVPLTDTLIEIRSLATHEGYQGRGVGGQLVQGLIEQAREREYKQICALTLRENFFLRLGFHLVDRWSISPKVWQACIYCPKFHRCDEVAVLMNLADQPMQVDVEELRKAGWNSLLRWGEWQPLRLAYQHKPGAQDEK
ncbi:MAG: GNAT family N-acetyltransferase [Litorilinea sp.]